MTIESPRPAKRRRLIKTKRALITGAKWTSYALVVAFALGWITLIIWGNLFWDHDDEKATEPAAKPSPTEPSTPITWPTITRQCRDGWNSPSIGQPGACSWHGGVITIYHSSLGNLATLCPPVGQPTTLERAQALLAADGTVDCDFGQTPGPAPLAS
ncbi:hypothetical protein [Streptomyces sp. NPDC059783]|uniref:hypothetical protein n=1 Tax=Streptomyces sp. NPDC059783 TaxID=3346944 RepID=UPI00364CCE9B